MNIKLAFSTLNERVGVRRICFVAHRAYSHVTSSLPWLPNSHVTKYSVTMVTMDDPDHS